MVKRVIGLLLLLSQGALAQYAPCSPVFIAGPQGRPLPGAVVQITKPDGSDPGPIKLDAAGTQQFANVLPSNQILQVFMENGTYLVVVSGEGITKRYTIVCNDAVASASWGIISIDRTAPNLAEVVSANPPSLVCSPSYPCMLVFDKAQGDQTFIVDFVMPTFSLLTSSITIEWFAQTAVGTTSWAMDWCTYSTSDEVCTPVGAHSVTTTSSTTDLNRKHNIVYTFTPATQIWSPSEHVMLYVTRNTTQDQVQTLAITNMRLEFNRQ